MNIKNGTPSLSARQEEAAILLAEDLLSDEEIAAKVGVSRSCLAKWKRQKSFAARVDAIADDFAERALQHGIARKDRRLAALQRRHKRLLAVIEDRASDPELQNVPGGSTGLVVRKAVVSAGQLVGFEAAVDTGTLRELRAIEEQVAKELGQLVEKSESKVDATIKDERSLSDDELRQEIAELSARLGYSGVLPASAKRKRALQ